MENALLGYVVGLAFGGAINFMVYRYLKSTLDIETKLYEGFNRDMEELIKRARK